MNKGHVGHRINENIVFKLWGHKELCSTLGISLQERKTLRCWNVSKKAVEGSGAQVLWGPAEALFIQRKGSSGETSFHYTITLKEMQNHRVQNHRIFWLGRVPQESSSPTLKWMAHTGIESTTLALLASSSDQCGDMGVVLFSQIASYIMRLNKRLQIVPGEI